MKSFKYIVFLAIFLVAFWSIFVEPNLFFFNHLNFQQKDLEGLKVVFVGDFHIKKYQRTRLREIVSNINKQNPDLILIAGDFVNGHFEQSSLPIEEISQELSRLHPRYGIYSVLGNHDWWQNGEKIKTVLQKHNITVLCDENKIVTVGDKKLCLVGVDDISTQEVNLDKAFKKTSLPTILLSHSPDVFPLLSDEMKIDLGLAGHTHGGQVVLPFFCALLVPSDYGQRYVHGIVKEKNRTFFITSGLGTSVLPIRFNCIPEIVVITFVK